MGAFLKAELQETAFRIVIPFLQHGSAARFILASLTQALPLCRFKLQVKSKYSGASKPPYHTTSMYIKKSCPEFFFFNFKRLQAGFALATSFCPV